nr:aminotransferase class IV [uncultured Carboxylicivirga sp.]
MREAISGQYFYINSTLKSINFFNRESNKDNVCVYEVFRVESTVPLFIEDHLLRLFNSANTIGLDLWKTTSQLKFIIKTLIQANNSEDGNIRIEFKVKSNKEKEFLSYFVPAHYPDKTQYDDGVLACFQEAERVNPTAKIFNAKVRGQANSIIEKEHVYETLLINHNNQITEGSRSNLFFIKDGIFYTAPDDMVLPGVIRKKVIEIINQKGWPIQFEAINKKDLYLIEAAFITGTSPRVLPIKKAGNIIFNVNHVNIKDLMQELNNLIFNYKIKSEIK